VERKDLIYVIKFCIGNNLWNLKACSSFSLSRSCENCKNIEWKEKLISKKEIKRKPVNIVK